MRPVVLVGVACAAVLVLAFSGCGTGGYTSQGSQGSGKKLFVQACGGCHTLADAGTNGKIGPNLDDAFAQAREAGMTSDTFTQVVATQIRYPITKTSTGAPGMPQVDTDAAVVRRRGRRRLLRRRPGPGGRRHRRLRRLCRGNGCDRRAADRREVDLHRELRLVPHAWPMQARSGTVGPNLDDAKPPKDLVVQRVTNGQGAMPSFKDSLDAAQIQAVADYVSSAAGK